MKYLCLAYYAPDAFDALTEAEREALAERCAPHDEAFRATGKVAALASLEHGTRVTLRPADGDTSVTDGPFTEAREIVGSFFILEADDLEEAVETASLASGRAPRAGARLRRRGPAHRGHDGRAGVAPVDRALARSTQE